MLPELLKVMVKQTYNVIIKVTLDLDCCYIE